MRKTKMEKGITLISLIVTIAILIILAAVAVNSITNDKTVDKTKNAVSEYEIMEEKTKLQKEILEWQVTDAGDMQTLEEYLGDIYGENNVQANTDESLTVTVPSGNKYIVTEDGDVTYTDGTTSNGGSSEGNTSGGSSSGESSSGGTISTTGTWTQNKTTVTNGTVTLEVGTTVTGYDAGDGSYTGGWAVLGAENGKLLLVSKTNVGNTELSGKDGYYNGIAELNGFCSSYLNSSFADEARSLNVEDINRVTGYKPENTGDGTRYGEGYPYQYGNTVIYAVNDVDDGYIHYEMVYTSKVATGDEASGSVVYSPAGGVYKFEHVDGRTLAVGSGSMTVTSNYYNYYASEYVKEMSEDESAVLFSGASYWLASQYVKTNKLGPEAGLRIRWKHYRRNSFVGCEWS